MLEEWKSIYFIRDGIIYDYRGLYKVSNYGRVKSVQRMITDKRGRDVWIKEKILSPKTDKKGYQAVGLHKDGIQICFYIHRLVALMFLPNPENKEEVDHIIPLSDGGTNRLDNLRWATPKENTNNPASKIKSDKSKIGRKISDSQKEKIRKANTKDRVIGFNGERYVEFDSVSQAKEHGYHHVGDCCRGKRGKSGGFTWYFINDSLPEEIKKHVTGKVVI